MQNRIFSYLIILFCFCFSRSAKGQITDVYTGEKYTYFRFSESEIFSKTIDTTSIQNSIFKGETNYKKNIEEQLKIDILKKVHDEYEFFQLQKSANQKQKNYIEIQEFVGNSMGSIRSIPDLNSIQIQLINVVNNWGVYQIEYGFNSVSVVEYKMGNYATNQIKNLSNKLTNDQKEVLKEVSINRFSLLYLLQTKKIELTAVNRILTVKSGREKVPSFTEKLDYNEALIYPYFSGIMIEFPSYSKASKPFYYKPFRILLTNADKEKMLPLFEDLQPVFSSSFCTPKDSVIKVLANDNLFIADQLLHHQENNLHIFNTHQKQLTEKTPSSIQIKKYSVFNSSEEDSLSFAGNLVFSFAKNGNLEREENLNSEGRVYSNKNYFYDEKDRLKVTYFTENYKEILKVFTYTKSHLNYSEQIEFNDYKTAHNQAMRDLKISQTYYVYHNNSRWSQKVNGVGSLSPNHQLQQRKISGGNIEVWGSYSVTSKGVKLVIPELKNSPLEIIRLNEKNQPLEIF